MEPMPLTENSEAVASELYTDSMLQSDEMINDREDGDENHSDAEMTVQQRNYLMHLEHEDQANQSSSDAFFYNNYQEEL